MHNLMLKFDLKINNVFAVFWNFQKNGYKLFFIFHIFSFFQYFQFGKVTKMRVTDQLRTPNPWIAH